MQRLPFRFADAEAAQHTLFLGADVSPGLITLAADMRGEHRLGIAALVVDHAGNAGQLEEDAFHLADQAGRRIGDVVHRHHVAKAVFQRDQRIVERLALVAAFGALRQTTEQRAEALSERDAPVARLEALGW